MISMKRLLVIWDSDLVLTKDRATTILARVSKEEPKKFITSFLEKAGEEGPLVEVPRKRLEWGFEEWQRRHGEIKTIYDLARCLTDLRHELQVFPSARQTKYTKTFILKGVSEEDIKRAVEGEIYIPDALQFVEALREIAIQVVFSDSLAPLIYNIAKKLNINYGKATPTYVFYNGEEIYFSPRLTRYVLSGRVEEKWKKKEEVLDYLERIEWEGRIIAIDDNKVAFLKALKERGVEVYLYYNEVYHKANKKYVDEAKKGGIPVVEELAEIIEKL